MSTMMSAARARGTRLPQLAADVEAGARCAQPDSPYPPAEWFRADGEDRAVWELRRKADRPVVTAGGDDPAPAPDLCPVRPTRGAAHGHEPEERRPFRNVEVRKLGPGRGRNRPRTSSHSRLQLPGQGRG